MSGVRLVALFSASLCLAVSSYAQFESSEVLGTLLDPSGSPVTKAQVTLTNEGTGIEAKTVSNDAGEYDFTNVRVGKYRVTASATGFAQASASNVDVVVGA